MLTEERRNEIEKLVNTKGSIGIQELMQLFDASESTIRRDLTELHKNNSVIKVHGGAISNHSEKTITSDSNVPERENTNKNEKLLIAQYASKLISFNDMIYLDAGTTTYLLIDYLPKDLNLTFVTNGIMHAKKLAAYGHKVFIPGGLYKSTTEAVVGEEAILTLSKYHFTKGFFGTNAINTHNGFTTPDMSEAMIKKSALHQCFERYILSDSSKFDLVSYISFGDFFDSKIITTNTIPENYHQYDNIIIV